MTELTWGDAGTKHFEQGLDRGVIYLPNGIAVPWNGLTSVAEEINQNVETVSYDGVKIHDIVSYGSFSAKVSAITYPDAMQKLEGTAQVTRGIYLSEQPSVRFGFCYRTSKGNDVDPEVGYKIHIVYNVSAVPSGRTYSTMPDDPEVTEFEWDITAVPQYVGNFRPSSHLILDSNKIDPLLLVQIEEILYGNSTADASLLDMEALVTYLNEWFRVKIFDNGDGTWTATSDYEGYIFPNMPPSPDYSNIRIQNVDSYYIDPFTYVITDSSIQVPDENDPPNAYTENYGSIY